MRSNNMQNKVNHNQFCKKSLTHECAKKGNSVFEVTKNPSVDAVENFKRLHKPKELTDEEKWSDIETEIKKEEIKEFVKNLNTAKSNLKKMHILVCGNCTDGVQTLLKSDSDCEEKSQNLTASGCSKR